MTIYNNSYETTAGRLVKTHPTEQMIKDAINKGDLSLQTLGVEQIGEIQPVFVLGIDYNEEKIPPFIHPFFIDDKKGSLYIVSDMRRYKDRSSQYINMNDFESHVKNVVEYKLNKNRAILEAYWKSNRVMIRQRFQFAANVFAQWISSTVNKTFALDLRDQAMMSAAALYYYNTLFVDGSRLEDEEREKTLLHSINLTKLARTDIIGLYNILGDAKDITDLTTLLKMSVSNNRLDYFTEAVLLTGIRNSWYGNDAKEILSVSLEYPPVWISVLFSTLSEKSYRNTPLFKTVETIGKRMSVDEFKMNYLDITKPMMASESIDNEPFVYDFIYKD